MKLDKKGFYIKVYWIFFAFTTKKNKDDFLSDSDEQMQNISKSIIKKIQILFKNMQKNKTNKASENFICFCCGKCLEIIKIRACSLQVL